ncbi:Uncharacterized protein SCF082_LOCUS34499 [Durusdinium trenchii]|uniref:Uncharacterized protein n=1 Tax=Durusdinium trenchii TaxID=1381693 RepID=A0ABP0NXP0_9DINO
MRFRLESHGCTRERVSTSVVGEVGLEQPDEWFVELEVYEASYGKADPNDIVYEEVNVRTGKAGWLKRIGRNFKSVIREAQLTDDVTIDPNRDVAGMMHAAARANVLNRPKVS